MTLRVGHGYDVHPFADDRPLVLGGVTIPGAPGLAGHSDADAVAHAVADALLSAADLPDLGTQYPADDDTHRDAASIGFLVDIAGRLAADGWSLANVAVTIAAERPRLAPHLTAIRTGVATALESLRVAGEDAVPVSVTPKRGEGLGAIGRGEGVAVWAICLIQR